MASFSPARRSAFLLAALLLLECAGLLALCEAVSSLADIDSRLMGKLLYYAVGEVHMLSKDPALHYELKPGASIAYREGLLDIVPFQTPYRSLNEAAINYRYDRLDTINSLGFHDPERSPAKPRGTKRIICLGSSNTYGAVVQNDQTYPARLEQLLNSRLPGKYEVWNAGVSAYLLTQNLATARKAIREYSPDLLIFQLQNCGRRPFLYGQPYKHFFAADPGLYNENLRFTWPWLPDFLRRSRFLRSVNVLANLISALADKQGYTTAQCYKMKESHTLEFEKFYEENRNKVRMAFLIDPGQGSIEKSHVNLSGLGIPTLYLNRELPAGFGKEYRKIHPPPYVYSWYAEKMFSWLTGIGYLPRVRGDFKHPPRSPGR